MQKGVGFFASLVTLILIVSAFTMTPQAASAALSGISVEPSNNIFNIESFYVVTFTTGTTGTIKTIDITFPSGFILANTKLIEISGISAGTLTLAGQTITYTVATPVSVPSGSKIQIMFGKIVNNFATPNNLTISTKDPSNITIDGPTASPGFLLKGIGNGMIVNGAVTNTKIANNSINGTQIKSGAITKANIAAGSGIVTGIQNCIGKVVTGFDSSGNVVCKSIRFIPDTIVAPDWGYYGVAPGFATSTAIGTDSFPVIGYFDVFHGLKLVHCTNFSCSNHDNPISLLSLSTNYTSIAIGSDGFPVISFYVYGAYNLELIHCTNVSCSTHDSRINLDTSSSDVGLFTSIAKGTDGFPVISYYDNANGFLKLIHCTNVSCSTHDGPITLDNLGNVGQYTSIAIGSDGFPDISYFDVGGGNLKFVHCTNISCSTFQNALKLELGNVGQYTSIAIGSDGFPVISYYDVGGANLKLFHCTNVSCTGSDPSVILDPINDVGKFTSIAIGSDGFPMISYYDVSNGFLRLVHCTNLSCTQFDLLGPLDTTGDVGRDSSIAKGADGLPVISYLDYTHFQLRVWHMGGIILS